ncbi:YegP family protein [Roseateles sp. P5_E11]
MSKFKIFRGKNGRWFWHLKASNGRIVADGAGQGKGYRSRRDAKRGVEAVRRAAIGAAPVLA